MDNMNKRLSSVESLVPGENKISNNLIKLHEVRKDLILQEICIPKTLSNGGYLWNANFLQNKWDIDLMQFDTVKIFKAILFLAQSFGLNPSRRFRLNILCTFRLGPLCRHPSLPGVVCTTVLSQTSLEVTVSFLLIVFDLLYSVLLDSVFFSLQCPCH